MEFLVRPLLKILIEAFRASSCRTVFVKSLGLSVSLFVLSACGVSTKTPVESSGKSTHADTSPVSGLSYTKGSFTLTKRVPMVPAAPILQKGTSKIFSISPALPKGITFDTVTGNITGQSDRKIDPTHYVVTASNPFGFSRYEFDLEVLTTDPNLSTVSAPQSKLTANGIETTTVTVQLKNRNGNPIINEPLRVYSDRKLEDISPAETKTDEQGYARFTVSSKVAGSAQIFAFDTEDQIMIPIGVKLDFLAGPATQLVWISPPTELIAGSALNLRVRALDAQNNQTTLLPGLVGISVLTGTLSAPDQIDLSNQGEGVFSSLYPTRIGNYSIQASAGGMVSSIQTIKVSPAAPSKLSFVNQPPTQATAGVNLTQNPSVQVLDQYGNKSLTQDVSITLKAYSDSTCNNAVTGFMDLATNPVRTDQGLANFNSINLQKTTIKAIGAVATDLLGNPLSPACSTPISIAPNLPSNLTSTLEATSPIPADGNSTSKLTITLLDSFQNPIPGQSPLLSITGSNNTVSTCSQTDALGKSSCTLSSKTAETKQLTLLLSTNNLIGPSVRFDAGVPTHFDLRADVSTLVAGSNFNLTGRALDQFDNLSTSYNGAVQFDAVEYNETLPTSIRFNSGLLSLTALSLNQAGSRTFTLRDSSTPSTFGTFGLTITPASYNLGASTLSVSTDLIKAGDALDLTLQAKDRYGNASPTGLPGLSFIRFTQNPALGNLEGMIDLGNGSYRIKFTGITTGTVSLSATLNGEAMPSAKLVPIIPSRPTQLKIVDSVSSTHAGETFKITVQALDAYSNLVSDFSGGGLLSETADQRSQLTAPFEIRTGQGSTAAITPITAGIHTYTITSDGLTEARTQVSVAPASASKLAFKTEPSATSIAGERLAQTPVIEVLDHFGNSVPDSGIAVILRAFRDSECNVEVAAALDYSPQEIKTESGIGAFSSIKVLKTEVVRIGAVSGNGIVSACSQALSIRSGNASSLTSTIEGTSSIVADGVSTSTVTIRLKDANGNPISGTLPTFSASDPGTNNTYGPCSTSDSSGTSTCSLSSKTSGAKVLTLTTPIQFQGGSVQFVPGAPTRYELRPTLAEMVAGQELAVTANAYDTNGNFASNYNGSADFRSTDPKIVGAGNFTFNSGALTISGVSLATAGDQTLTLSDSSLPDVSGRVLIKITPAEVSLETSVLSLSQSSIPSGSTIRITLTTKDRFGNTNPIGNHSRSSILFKVSSTTANGEMGSTEALETGVYAASFRGVKVGDLLVSAVLDANPFKSTRTLTINPGTATQLRITASPGSGISGASFSLSAEALDANQNRATDYNGKVTITTAESLASNLPSEVTFQSGSGTFSGLTIYNAGTATLSLSAPGLTGASSAMTIRAAAPSALAFKMEPSSAAIAGSTFDAAPSIVVLDAYQNPISNSGVSISLKAYSDDRCSQEALGTLSANQNPISASGLETSFGNLKITQTRVTRIGVSGTDSNGVALTGACSRPITLSPGSVSLLKSQITGSGPTKADGTASASIQITLLDEYSNPVPGLTPRFSATDTQSTNTYGACTVSDNAGLSLCSLRSRKAENKALSLLYPVNLSGESIAFISGSATHFYLASSTLQSIAGQAIEVSATALDANENIATDYLGAVSLQSSDSKAILPINLEFKNGEASRKVIPNLILKTAGSQTITLSDQSDPSIRGTSSALTIVPGAVSQSRSLLSTNLSTLESGSSLTLTLYAKDEFDNSNPSGISGSAGIAFSQEPNPGRGEWGTLQALGNGVYATTFQGLNSGGVTLKGSIDGVLLTNTQNITINPGPAIQFLASLSNDGQALIAGETQRVNISAYDQNWNVATNYSGRIHITTTDSASQVTPAEVALTRGNGTADLIFRTSGTYTFTLDDGKIQFRSSSYSVLPATLSELTFIGIPTSTQAGTPLSGTITAKDRFGNVVTSNEDSISLSYSDLRTTIPASTKLTLGTGTLSFTPKASGVFSVSVTNGRLSSSTLSLSVTPAQASVLANADGDAQSAVAGNALSAPLRIQVLDAFSNAVEGVRVFWKIESGSGSLSLSSSLTNSDGYASVALTTGTTAGSHQVSASLSGGPTHLFSATGRPGPASQLVLESDASSATAGTPIALLVKAKDQYGNTATSYDGTLNFQSTDSIASLPGPSTLAQGTGSFSVTLKRSGTQTIQVKDASLSSNTLSLTISASQARSLAFTTEPSSSGDADTPLSTQPSISILDTYGNIASTFDQRVTLAAYSDDTCSTVVSGALMAAELNATSGVAHFTELKATKTEVIRIGASALGLPSVCSRGMIIHAGAVKSLTLDSNLSTLAAGSPLMLTIKAFDGNQNLETELYSSVSITSTDGTFVPLTASLDRGSIQTTAVLNTAGPQTFTVRLDSISRTSSTIQVSPAPTPTPSPTPAVPVLTEKLASIQSRLGTCTGILISPHKSSNQYILTSVHCVEGLLPEEIHVKIGGRVDAVIQRIENHPAYDATTHQSDIALIQVDDTGLTPFDLSSESGVPTAPNEGIAFSWNSDLSPLSIPTITLTPEEGVPYYEFFDPNTMAFARTDHFRGCAFTNYAYFISDANQGLKFAGFKSNDPSLCSTNPPDLIIQINPLLDWIQLVTH